MINDFIHAVRLLKKSPGFTLTIRQARLADAEALLEFAARTYYEAFAPLNTPENMQAYMSSAFTLRFHQRHSSGNGKTQEIRY